MGLKARAVGLMELKGVDCRRRMGLMALKGVECRRCMGFMASADA